MVLTRKQKYAQEQQQNAELDTIDNYNTILQEIEQEWYNTSVTLYELLAYYSDKRRRLLNKFDVCDTHSSK